MTADVLATLHTAIRSSLALAIKAARRRASLGRTSFFLFAMLAYAFVTGVRPLHQSHVAL